MRAEKQGEGDQVSGLEALGRVGKLLDLEH